MNIVYVENYVGGVVDAEFKRLWETLDWQMRENTPRRECWMNDFDLPYTYGSGEYARTYGSAPWDDFVRNLMVRINSEYACALNCCFINGYAHQRQHLGWHADDSVEMSMDEPVAVVSLGAEREIWFRPKDDRESISKQLLGNGSLLIMPPGMQRTHDHRIPKSSREVGPRVSLTYRGLLQL